MQLNQLYDRVEQVFIAKEFAPAGQCECKKLGNEEGCPFCNPALIPAWRKSCEIEAEFML